MTEITKPANEAAGTLTRKHIKTARSAVPPLLALLASSQDRRIEKW